MIDPRTLRRMAAGMALTVEMAATVVLGVVAGAWLDRRIGTSPVFLLLLSLGALAGGIARLVRATGRFEPEDEAPPDDPDLPRPGG